MNDKKNPKKGSKMAKVLEHLKTHGSITVREMATAPFYINCPYRVIDNLRDVYGLSILDEYIVCKKQVVYQGKVQKVTNKYKRYFLKKWRIND